MSLCTDTMVCVCVWERESLTTFFLTAPCLCSISLFSLAEFRTSWVYWRKRGENGNHILQFSLVFVSKSKSNGRCSHQSRPNFCVCVCVCVDEVQQAKVIVIDTLNSDLGHFVICRNKSASNQILLWGKSSWNEVIWFYINLIFIITASLICLQCDL